jgi:hypothetical protein
VADAYPGVQEWKPRHRSRTFPPYRTRECLLHPKEVNVMAKDHGSSVKNDKQYEGLRKKGMSKERAAKISNTSGASKKGGKKQTGGSGGGTKEGQRKGGRKSGKSS